MGESWIVLVAMVLPMRAMKVDASGAKAIKAMKAMKVTKVMKAMKAMKAKSMKSKRVSKIATGRLARAAVFSGKKEKTVSGLTKESLFRNKAGKIVSKAASARLKKAFASSAMKKWTDAVKQARTAMGIQGFCPVGGQTAQGKALYAKIKSIVMASN